MKCHIFLLLIVSLTFSQVAFSQIKFSYGPEIGFNISGSPHWSHYTIEIRNDKIKETNMPVVSPVVGLWSKINFGKHLFVNLGVQYLWVGNKYHYHRDGNDLGNHVTYTSDNWENQTFQKLSVPLSIGYDFKIKKVKANIFIGYRKNYFISGSYTTKGIFAEENQPGVVETEELNPFDNAQFSEPAKRWNSGLFIGIGSDITRKIRLTLTYSRDLNIFYGNSYGWEGYYHEYSNSDLSFTIKYAF